MRVLNPARRGIVLVSVIFVTVLVGMYLLSAHVLSQGQFGALKQHSETRLAEEAARSGIEYALARLQENPEWRGDGNGVIVDSPNFSVREDQGNVVGLVRSADGGTAQFRLRFNFQDGNGGADELDDPDEVMAFDSPHISINNLLGTADAAFPLGDGPNGQAGTVLPYPVPPGSVALVCEGRVAADFHQATAVTPNPAEPSLQSVRIIEEFHRIEGINGQLPVVDAVSMAGRLMNVNLYNGGVMNLYDISGGKATMRAKDQIRVNDGNGEIVGPNGEVMVPSGNPEAILNGGVTPGEEDVNTAFYELAWDQVKEPRADAGELKAGMYVYWNTPPRGLRYYDMSHAEYMNQMQNDPNFVTNPGVEADLPAGMAFVEAGDEGPDGVTSSRHRFVVTDDVLVVSGDNTDDLTVMPRGGAKESVSDPDAAEMAAEAEPVDIPDAVQSMFRINPDTPMDSIPEEIYNGLVDNGEWSEQDNVHQLLQMLGNTGSVYNDDVADNSVAWNPAEITDDNGEKEGLLARFLAGERHIEGVSIPNLAFLEESPAGSGRYMIRREAFFASLRGEAIPGGNPDKLNEIDLEGKGISGEDLGPEDFELTFAPQSANGLSLQGPGDIRLATDVRGQGASIKAEGQIRVVGVGMTMDAAIGEDAPRVSLYAKDDIVISTLRGTEDGNYEFQGLDLRGILYSWKNITLKSAEEDYPSPGVRIQGTMVAFAGDPANDQPGAGAGGNITMDGDAISLIFDPSYLLGLTGGEGLTAVLGQVSTSYRN
jgi:hypothetical protein